MTTPYEPGTRVFAVLSANANQVLLLGFGTYLGDHPRGPENFPEGDYEMVAEAIRKSDENPLDSEAIIHWEIEEGHTPEGDFDKRMAEVEERQRQEHARPMRERAHELLCKMNLNPKIELDNGDVVWGYQCWWGPEEQWSDEFIRGREVKEVSIGDYT